MSAPGLIFDGTDEPETIRGTRGDDSISGAGKADLIADGMGNDVVFGGDGDDYVWACFGDDWYHGGDQGASGDTISFYFLDMGPDGAAATYNMTGVVFDLQKRFHDLGELGHKTVFGFENVDGSFGNDALYGTAGGNKLLSDLGNDFLDGRAGNDTLIGGLHQDVLVGGAGADVLCASHQNSRFDEKVQDIFRYNATSESGVIAATRDTIWGAFDGAGTTGDLIDLRRIDADPVKAGNQLFSFINSALFKAAAGGQVRVVQVDPTVFRVEVDNDLDARAEMSFIVNSDTTLVKGDFLL